MRNYFIILICLFLLCCSTAQEIVNSGQVKIGMSQRELRSALLTTSISEDPFLSSCLRNYFRDEKVLIMAARNQTAFFIFKDVYSPGNCDRYGDGSLVAVKYNYQNALTFVKNNFSKKTTINYSNEINSNLYRRFITLKKSYIMDYKRKLFKLNYLERANSFSIEIFDDEFQLAITKFIIDEGECGLAEIIISTSGDNLILKMQNAKLISHNRIDDSDYCKNNLYSFRETRKYSVIQQIYIDYIFTDKFSTLLNNASKRVS